MRGDRLLVDGALDRDLTQPLADLAEHGYARLGRVASDEALRAMRARIDEIMLGRVSYDGLFFQKDTDTTNYDDLTYGRGYEGPSLNYRKVEKLEVDPVYRAWIENPLFERVARALIADDVVLYRALVFNKASSGGSNLPWHQDGGKFWGLDRDPTLQIWTALDDCPVASGCVEIIPKTHAAGLATPLGGLVPRDIVAARDAEGERLALPASAGEVILIHNHAWHRSGVNTTGKARRAFTVCYMSAATRCLRKKKAPRVFVPVFRRPP